MATVEQTIRAFNEQFNQIHSQLSKVIVGQEHVITELLIAVLTGGHVLLEGLPGLGKTQLIKALAATIDVSLSRVQCTSDLMPADITGAEILSPPGSHQYTTFEFRPGPIFSNLVLVDEINRATPKTQSALLEAMQEHQITCAGASYPLPVPFWIIATQNPIELEGTYPLPEAQLDRFVFKISIQYPATPDLLKMLDVSLDSDPVKKLPPLMDGQQLTTLSELGNNVIVADAVKQAAVKLILATHGELEAGSSYARKHIRYGASPRGLQAVIRAARIKALINGRAHVDTEDIAEVALPALRHRLILKFESELEGTHPDQVLQDIIKLWKKSQAKTFYRA